MSDILLPYPGLRSFRSEEWEIFCGRDQYIDAMIKRLIATRFLAVVGASGSGKSSLVRTGLVHALRMGFLAQAGSRWTVVRFQPGHDPIGNLARSMVDKTVHAGEESDVKALKRWLSRSPRSLAEWYETGALREGQNLLLIVDQFEELFRYSDYAERDEAESFVDLLIRSAETEGLPIYVVLTMRSEFLGACALIQGLAEKINAGFYLTPRMKREECCAAIEGPASKLGFTVQRGLVNQLLNDMAAFAPWEQADSFLQSEVLARRADQLPMMQHLLNQLWLLATAEAHGGPVELTLKQYTAVGKLNGALNSHGQCQLDAIPEDIRHHAETIFRALMDGQNTASAVRRPCPFGVLAKLTGNREATARIVNHFRATGCAFLQPEADVSLSDETRIDITHESLIRQWNILADWLEKEVDAAKKWRYLLHSKVRFWRDSPRNLLRDDDLAIVTRWWQQEQPTEAWSERYRNRSDASDPSFSEVDDFVRKSQQAEKERVDAEKELRDSQRRSKILLILVCAVVVICFAAYAYRDELDKAKEAQNLQSERERSAKIFELEEASKRDINAAFKKELPLRVAEATKPYEDKLAAQSKIQASLTAAQRLQLAKKAEENSQLTEQSKALETQVGELKQKLQTVQTQEQQEKVLAQIVRDTRKIATNQKKIDQPSEVAAVPPKPALPEPPAEAAVTISVGSGHGSENWIYKLDPELYVDGHPLAYVDAQTWFSAHFLPGVHRFCVSDPLTPDEDISCVQLRLTTSAVAFATIEYKPASSSRAGGRFQIQKAGDAIGTANKRQLAKDRVIDPTHMSATR